MNEKPIRIRVAGSGSVLAKAPQAGIWNFSDCLSGNATSFAELQEFGIPIFFAQGPWGNVVTKESVIVYHDNVADAFEDWCTANSIGEQEAERLLSNFAANCFNWCLPKLAHRIVLHTKTDPPTLRVSSDGKLIHHIGRQWFSKEDPTHRILPFATAQWTVDEKAVLGHVSVGRFLDKDTDVSPYGNANYSGWSSRSTPWMAPGYVISGSTKVIPGPKISGNNYYHWGDAIATPATFVSDSTGVGQEMPLTEEAFLQYGTETEWLKQRIPDWDNGLHLSQYFTEIPTNQTGPCRCGTYLKDGRPVLIKGMPIIPKGMLEGREVKLWDSEERHYGVRIGTCRIQTPGEVWQHPPFVCNQVALTQVEEKEAIPYYFNLYEDGYLDNATLVLHIGTGYGNELSKDESIVVVFYCEGYLGRIFPETEEVPEFSSYEIQGNVHTLTLPANRVFRASNGVTLDDHQSATLRYAMNRGETEIRAIIYNRPVMDINAAWGSAQILNTGEGSMPEFDEWVPPQPLPWL